MTFEGFPVSKIIGNPLLMKFVFALLFLLILGLSTYLSRPLYESFLQKHMSERIARNFSKAGISGVEVEFDHLHASLRGEIGSSDQREAALGQVDRVWGAYVADTSDLGGKLLPPANLDAQLQDGVLVLSGKVPDAKVKAAIVDAAASIQGVTSVNDKLEIAEVAPALWSKDASNYLDDLFAHSANGKLSLSQEDVRVSGLVESQEDHDRLASAARGLASSDTEFTEALEVLSWQDPHWKINGGADRIVIEGLLPDTETQAALYKSVEASSGDTPIEDRTTTADRVRPAWWNDHAGRLLPGLTANGASPYFVRYDASSVVARSTVPSESSLLALETMVNGSLPDGVASLPEFTLAVTEPEPALADQLKLLPVYFGTDSSEILADEVSKIDKAAEVIEQAGGKVALTVGGYADLRGSAEYNRALSLRRANAVRTRLIGLGVPADYLKVDHFGEDTSEMADEDLWKSRRVELSITPSN